MVPVWCPLKRLYNLLLVNVALASETASVVPVERY